MSRIVSVTLLFCALATAQVHAQDAPKAPAPQGNDAASNDALREDAKRLFERGLGLLEKGDFAGALVDFRRSREVFPTRSATENVAVCLRELGETVAAFETFSTMLAEFPDAPAEVRTRVETQVKLLEAQLATLVFAADAGTAVTVDGRPVGKLPLEKPVRVVAGRNVVRMYLEGHAVFETQIRTERGKETRVEGTLQLLGTVGRLRVKEKSGAAATVLVDGVVVGVTPWEGSLSPGSHAVWLSIDDGKRGSAPTRARIILAQKTDLELALEPLDAQLKIVVSPPDAAIALDGVTLGTAIVETALPARTFKVDVTASGYTPHAEVVTLKAGRRALDIKLAPVVPDTSKTADPFELGLAGAAALSPSLDGVSCDDCARSVGAGFYAALVGGYRLPFGLGFELEVGYHRATGTLDRTVELEPVGVAARATSFSETYLLTGATVLGGASYRPPLDELLFLSVGSHFGGYVGGARVTRNVTGVDSAGEPWAIGPYESGSSVLGLVIKPELRGGISPTPWLDIWISGAAMILFPLEVEPWSYDALVPVGSDGAARFATEELWSTQPHLMPGLGLGLSL